MRSPFIPALALRPALLLRIALVPATLWGLSSLGCSSSDEPVSANPAGDTAAPATAPAGGTVQAGPSEERAPVRGETPSADSAPADEALLGEGDPNDQTEVDERAATSSSRPAKRRASTATQAGPRDRAGDASKGAPSPEPPKAAGELSVKRLVIATDVAEREPLHVMNVISKAATEKVVAFVEVHNPERAQTELRVMFHPPTRPAFPVALSIGALERYRTWAYTRKLEDLGTWRVEVKSGAGDVLATSTFQLTE